MARVRIQGYGYRQRARAREQNDGEQHHGVLAGERESGGAKGVRADRGQVVE